MKKQHRTLIVMVVAVVTASVASFGIYRADPDALVSARSKWRTRRSSLPHKRLHDGHAP